MRRGKDFQETVSIAAAGSANVKAAATGTNYTVTEIVIAISVFQATGVLELTDGTTTFFGPWLCKDGNGNNIHLRFKDGFSWGKGKAIVVKVTTANVTARVTVKGFLKS